MIDQLSRLLEPIKRRLMLMVGRGLIQLSKDSGPTQRLQVSLMADEVRDNLERVQEYGFTSRPKPGAEAVVLFPGGSRDFGLVIAVDDRRYRLKSLQEGEVALYTDEGDAIHLKRGGTIEIKAASKVIVDSPSIEIGSGALQSALNGESFQALFNSHVHTSSPPGSPTSPPIVPSTAAELSTTLKVKG